MVLLFVYSMPTLWSDLGKPQFEYSLSLILLICLIFPGGKLPSFLSVSPVEWVLDGASLVILILLPSVLALSVIRGLITHGRQVLSEVIRAGTDIQLWEMPLSQLFVSIVLSVVAAPIPVLTCIHLYHQYVSDAGGLSPLPFVWLLGGILAVLVLFREIALFVFSQRKAAGV